MKKITLKLYRGIGLLVSHDRKLLDDLCTNILFILPGCIKVYKCNYTTAHLELEKENADFTKKLTSTFNNQYNKSHLDECQKLLNQNKELIFV